MARVTCRCGERLKVEGAAPDRLDCPKCGARIRLKRKSRRDPGDYLPGDGFLRFYCPCGRRLKVAAKDNAEAGKCPDCGRVVPIPEWVKSGATGPDPGDPESRTAELDPIDLVTLERWSAKFSDQPPPRQPSTTSDTVPVVNGDDLRFLATPPGPSSIAKFEAGLRVCPRCNKPVHLSATACRECGTPIPRA